MALRCRRGGCGRCRWRLWLTLRHCRCVLCRVFGCVSLVACARGRGGYEQRGGLARACVVDVSVAGCVSSFPRQNDLNVSEWYLDIPPVTRAYFTLSFLLTAATAMELVSPFSLYLNVQLVLEKGEVRVQ